MYISLQLYLFIISYYFLCYLLLHSSPCVTDFLSVSPPLSLSVYLCLEQLPALLFIHSRPSSSIFQSPFQLSFSHRLCLRLLLCSSIDVSNALIIYSVFLLLGSLMPRSSLILLIFSLLLLISQSLYLSLILSVHVSLTLSQSPTI